MVAMALGAATVVALFESCGPMDANVQSLEVGHLIDVPVERVEAFEEIAETCGASEESDASLTRRPYLQDVSSHEAALLWTSTASDEVVRIEQADGELVVEAVGEDMPTRFLPEGAQRRIRVGGLSPATTYCYSIYRGDALVFGPAGFRTAPDDLEAPVDFVVFGDSGSGRAEQWMVRDQLLTVPSEFVVHVGDVAYENGSMESFEEFFFEPYAEIGHSVPFFLTAGNHDLRTAGGGPYYEIFEHPTNGGDDLGGRYSFDWGPIHFISINTNDIEEDERAWVAEDLASTDKPWKIAYMHHPMYSSGSEHGSNLVARGILEDVLVEHGVQLVFAGDDHHYERTSPQRGVTYIVTGGGGRGTRPVGHSDFTVFSEDVLHFVSVHVEGSDLRLYAIDAMGAVFDSVHLTL